MRTRMAVIRETCRESKQKGPPRKSSVPGLEFTCGGRLSDELLKFIRDNALRYDAENLIYLLASFEEEQIGNLHDAKLDGEILLFIDIDLEHLRLAVEFLGHGVDGRSKAEAGLAPGRPEIHEYGYVRLNDLCLPIRVRYRGGFTHLTPPKRWLRKRLNRYTPL